MARTYSSDESRAFHSLTVQDLLEIRDAYHIHLARKDNVVGTAIGLYLIRRLDPDAKRFDAQPRSSKRTGVPRRTLSNTVVRPWSWPCVLVFVNSWQQKDELRDADELIPSHLFLPDGRVARTCVVEVGTDQSSSAPLTALRFPRHLVGGGYPVITDVQNSEHVASLGCLVTDGDHVYALTNRHVTGPEGRSVHTIIGGEKIKIGVSDSLQIGKRPFSQVYPGWAGTNTLVNLDAGLVRVSDITRWTAQVYGIGEIDVPVDIGTSSITLSLIGKPVKAFGGASGVLLGSIHALFYRYKTVAGSDYVADLLIGDRGNGKPLSTRPGDSGTMWFLDVPPDPKAPKTRAPASEATKLEGGKGIKAPRLKPVALQWGGQTLMAPGEGSTEFRFALGTFLSTICRELDVEVVRDWNIGHNEYWGKVGHYKIAEAACWVVTNKKLAQLLKLNVNRISFNEDDIGGGQMPTNKNEFVPLADVADIVWRSTRKLDSANHFADMDQEGEGEFSGQTLLDLCASDKNVDPEVWVRFYESIGTKPQYMGALPFRVWQMWEEMVNAASEPDVARFICAAGLMAHYVGDASQPLHISRLHHGSDESESDVHSTCDTTMLDRFSAEIIAGVNSALGDRKARTQGIFSGHKAAVAAVRLMANTIKTLPPEDVIRAFNEGSQSGGRTKHMYDELGPRSAKCMAESVLTLGSLWQSAWEKGGGNDIADSKIKAVSKAQLQKLYDNREFLEAARLPEMVDMLKTNT